MSSTKQTRSFWSELQRRNVVRVALAYAGAAWILVQIASVFVPALGLPEWVLTVTAVGCIAGFPIAIVLAWAFEWTSTGVALDSDTPDSHAIKFGGRIIDYAIIGLLTIALSWFALDKYVWSKHQVLDNPVIAVLPFSNFSDDDSRNYFADGISEELLNMLTRVEGLHVIGRTSAFQFKDHSKDLRDIGEKLGANYLLEGSVRISADQVKIDSNLIDVEDGVRIWSDTFNGTFDDAFQLQELIARAVVTRLKIDFLDVKYAPQSSEAYNLYLQGLRYLRVPGRGDAARAIQLLEKAVELDPSMAPAWVKLYRAYSYQVVSGQINTEEGVAKLNRVIKQALTADTQNADVYESLGHFEATFNLDWKASEAAYQRALELVPEHAGALGGAGGLAAAKGQIDKALSLVSLRQKIDPLNFVGMHNEAFYHYINHDFEMAEQKARETMEFAGESYMLGHTVASLALMGQGKYQEALIETSNEPAEPLRLANQSIAYFKLGQTEAADKALNQLTEKYGDRLAVAISGVLAQRGEFDQSFEWTERAIRQKDPNLRWTNVHPMNDPLKDDPRFHDVLIRLGLD